MARPEEKAENASAKKVSTVVDGRRVSLSDLPMIPFRLNCGHVGKDFAIQVKDLIFCEDCGGTSRVTEILSD